jgi:hypothetical protein
VTDAQSDNGQFIYAMLVELGITPNEWRNMDSRDTLWLLSAHSEKNRRANQKTKQAQHTARAKQMTRR